MSRKALIKWREEQECKKQRATLNRTENKANLAAQSVYYDEISRLFKVLAKITRAKSK